MAVVNLSRFASMRLRDATDPSKVAAVSAAGAVKAEGAGTAGVASGGVMSVQSPGLVLRSGVIASGDTTGLSTAIQTNGVPVVGIEMPPGWTAAPMSFISSVDGSNYQPVWDQYGNEFVITVAAGRNLFVDSARYFWMANYLKARSGTEATPVTQGADRTVKLITAP